jgi:hypothetical protein
MLPERFLREFHRPGLVFAVPPSVRIASKVGEAWVQALVG